MKRTTTKPRARNQRVSNSRQRRQQHLLDVKVRSSTMARQRNRRVLVFLSRIALVLALVAGLIFGVREGAKRLFFENPDYRVSEINVQTDGT